MGKRDTEWHSRATTAIEEEKLRNLNFLGFWYGRGSILVISNTKHAPLGPIYFMMCHL